MAPLSPWEKRKLILQVDRLRKWDRTMGIFYFIFWSLNFLKNITKICRQLEFFISFSGVYNFTEPSVNKSLYMHVNDLKNSQVY